MKKVLFVLFILISNIIYAQNDSIKWKYANSVDEMSEKQNLFAYCVSNNKVYFDFPYNGGSKMTIIVRKMGDSNSEVLIMMDKGQFNYSSKGTPILIKFDDGKIESFNCSNSMNGKLNILFINYPELFIKELKKSSKCKIQGSFYKQDEKVFYFDTKGIAWNYE